MIELGLVTKAIANIARPAAPFLINKAQRNEQVVRILKDLKLEPTQPPKDVDGIYVYALVEYGVFQAEPILKLFREKAVKNAFWQAYTSNQPMRFLHDVERFLQGHDDLRKEIQRAGIEIRSELEKFGEAFISVAQRAHSPECPTPYPDWDLDTYPKEFKSLIQEKTKIFCGREFVFKAFQRFLEQNNKGYFTVIGDAGMGKSAIAAKYVYATESPCFFNIRAEGRNRPELFLESIRKQLIKKYQLQNADKDSLQALIVKASKNLTNSQRLVIVIDALDEIDQEGTANLLDLPTTPPEKVYFLLTRRPYLIERKRLYTSPEVATQELDLRNEYVVESQKDIKEYIQLFLKLDPEHKQGLAAWIQSRNISTNTFVEEVASKSENNFMYLRYVLPSIARGIYDDLNLRELPNGLKDYYQIHWTRMGMETEPKELMVLILFTLVEVGTPIPSEMIAEIVQADDYEVQKILDEWVEYLRIQEIERETCYGFYHASFLDFLKAKRELKRTRRLFEQVNQRIVDYFEKIEAEGSAI